MKTCNIHNNISPGASSYNTAAWLRTMGQNSCRIKLFLPLLLMGLALINAMPLAAKEKITISPAGIVSWRDMVRFQQENPSYGMQPKIVPFMPGPDLCEIGKDRGTTEQMLPLSPPPEGAKVEASIPVTRGFQALDDDNTAIPPDTMGAAGPNHLMTILNSQVRIQNKRGTIISTVSSSTFWTSGTDLSGKPFDPRLIFDSLSNRWMAVVDANSWSSSSSLWFAVSDDDDPTGNWTYYSFDADSTDTDFAEFPDIGVNSTWVAITNNMYEIIGGVWKGCKMWVIDKSTLGGSLTVTEFDTGFDDGGGYTGFTLRPCVTFDATEAILYITDHPPYDYNGIHILRLSRITGSGPSPSWSAVPGSSWSNTGFFLVDNNFNYTQIDASQLGTSTEIDTDDTRMLSAVFRNGHVWCTHSAGLPVSPSSSNRTAVFWYELDPTTWTPNPSIKSPIVQSGVVDGGVGVHHFFPSIAVNSNNDVALGFSRSDSTRYSEAVVTSRQSSDPADTMGSITVIKAGEDSYVKDFGTGIVRWGDYSATVVDPADDLTFWTIQEYAETDVGGGASDDRWGTWWARVSFGTVSNAGPLLLLLLE